MAEVTGIRKRDVGYQWNVSYKGKRQVGTTKTLEGAIKERQKALMSLMEGEGVEDTKKGSTLKDIVKITHQTRWQGQKSERTHLINAEIALTLVPSKLSRPPESMTLQSTSEATEQQEPQ